MKQLTQLGQSTLPQQRAVTAEQGCGEEAVKTGSESIQF